MFSLPHPHPALKLALQGISEAGYLLPFIESPKSFLSEDGNKNGNPFRSNLYFKLSFNNHHRVFTDKMILKFQRGAGVRNIELMEENRETNPIISYMKRGLPAEVELQIFGEWMSHSINSRKIISYPYENVKMCP